ncbi:mitogen-activated protein kinase kinase kinase 9-like isoform X3 [Tamandua tetradactyla]|uniref:mitogen-activated protein kinase kinase kinase 9-like isoform X3 n=1 Tax=Tamandua tetradactyla TaxID=48850 RepID=UPI0040538417
MTPYICGIYVKRDLPYSIHLNFAEKGYPIFGVPTVLSDIPALRIRCISDRTNYGEEGNAYSLLHPTVFNQKGVFERDFFKTRSEEEELRTWEEELTWAALQQKNLEELLRCREQELAEWEIDILEWELNIILHQLCQEKPRLKKRMGKFRKSRLKLKNGNHISLPSAHLG